MPRASPRARVAILGCGAAGTAFAVALAELRPRTALTVWSRSEARVARLLAAVQAAGGDPREIGIAGSPGAALEAAEVVLLCIADPALPAFARRLAREPARARVALAASGSIALARLAPLRARGTAVGRLHPLLPLLPGSGAALLHAPFGLEGEPRALRAARGLVRRLEGIPLELRPGAAAGYHAGAALLGGGLVALLHLAEQALAPRVRASRAELAEALLVFTEEVAANVRLEGAAAALTGPIARGAPATVRANLGALRGVAGAAEAYRVLGRTLLTLTRARGGLDARAERELRRLLAPRHPRRR